MRQDAAQEAAFRRAQIKRAIRKAHPELSTVIEGQTEEDLRALAKALKVKIPFEIKLASLVAGLGKPNE